MFKTLYLTFQLYPNIAERVFFMKDSDRNHRTICKSCHSLIYNITSEGIMFQLLQSRFFYDTVPEADKDSCKPCKLTMETLASHDEGPYLCSLFPSTYIIWYLCSPQVINERRLAVPSNRLGV